MEKTTDLVIGSSLGSELSQEEAGVIADLMSHREVVDGEFLIDEGATDDTLHVLLSGKLEVVKHTGAGETASLAILRPGALVGEMSFIDGAVHTVGLRALSDCRVLSLTSSTR
jgi:CRP-like cAMP-binding protein